MSADCQSFRRRFHHEAEPKIMHATSDIFGFYLVAALRTLEEQHFQYLSVMWIWSIYQYSMTSWRDSHAAICFLCYDIGSKNGETVSSWCDC